METQSKYLSAKQVGNRYSVSARSIWRYAAENRIPPPKTLFGNLRRWDIEDLEQWEAEYAR